MVKVKEYISQSEFCRRLGITKRTLFLAKQNGRVKVERGPENYNKMEWHEQRKNFVDTSDDPDRYDESAIKERIRLRNSKAEKEKKKSGSLSKRSGAEHPMDNVEEPEDEDGDFTPGMNRAQAEAVKQVYLAKQAKLKFLKDAGILIESQIVKKEWEEIAVRVQKAMMAIPDRVAEIFASMTDAHAIHKDLTKEIIHALSSLHYQVKSGDKDDRIEKVVEDTEE